jgi:hypothetical protein
MHEVIIDERLNNLFHGLQDDAACSSFLFNFFQLKHLIILVKYFQYLISLLLMAEAFLYHGHIPVRCVWQPSGRVSSQGGQPNNMQRTCTSHSRCPKLF